MLRKLKNWLHRNSTSWKCFDCHDSNKALIHQEESIDDPMALNIRLITEREFHKTMKLHGIDSQLIPTEEVEPKQDWNTCPNVNETVKFVYVYENGTLSESDLFSNHTENKISTDENILSISKTHTATSLFLFILASMLFLYGLFGVARAIYSVLVGPRRVLNRGKKHKSNRPKVDISHPKELQFLLQSRQDIIPSPETVAKLNSYSQSGDVASKFKQRNRKSFPALNYNDPFNETTGE